MGNYALDFYRQMLVSLRRGNYRGIISNAKPIFFLSLIEFIPYAKKNLFVVEDKKLNTIYKWYMKMYGAINTTPISYPYFHLQTEPFYQVIWKDENKIIRAAESPSVKQIKEYIIGMKLDDELWELLQDPGNREYLRNCIIKHYLS